MLKIAEQWFEITRVDERITHLTEPYVVPFARCNIWHCRGRERDLVVDFGMGIGDLKAAMENLLQRPVVAVATHSHHDHMGSIHQFDQRCIHCAEAVALAQGCDFPVLRGDLWPQVLREAVLRQGYDVPDMQITALPWEGFDVEGFRPIAAAATQLLQEGDVIDLGDLGFEVLHLPGHSPGSIGLWSKELGVLFSGDTVYDGPLLDETPGADIPDYIRSMKRLLQLPVNVVHAGHDPSFGRARLVELCTQYLESRD